MENTMTQSPTSVAEKTPSKFLAFWRKVYHPLGFKKGYNFVLFVIFAGAMLGFTLARLSFLSIGGTARSSFANSSSPGEWYWYRTNHYRIGITLHLGTILPAGFLMIWQFIPIIRHKLLMFHRINGYLIIVLVFVSNAGALMICRRSFGGTLDTQAGVGTLVILTTVSLSLAYYNIKRLQIDQHRKWMLRAMFYLGSIITLRLVQVIAATIISGLKSYFTIRTCGEIFFLNSNNRTDVGKLYPQCTTPNSTPTTQVIVPASFTSGRVEQIGASLGITFGMAIWLSLIMHLIGVEIYLALTPRESNRLRRVSYERQLERGFGSPGSAGLTSDRWGDADTWVPKDRQDGEGEKFEESDLSVSSGKREDGKM